MSNYRAFVVVLALCCMMAMLVPDLSGSARGLAAIGQRELQSNRKVRCSMRKAGGGSSAVDLTKTSTVRQVRFQIQKRMGIRQSRQVLKYNGLRLDESRTVSSYNLPEDAAIDVQEDLNVALPATTRCTMKKANGQSFTANIEKTATIREIKFQLQNEVAIDVDRQALSLNGNTLNETRSVTSYSIPDDAVIEVKDTGAATGGVNGDPLIIGLADQLFYFNGRSGAYYSAVSAPSLQWNMKITKYEGCPAHSNTFVSGAGFTFFDEKKAEHKVEVSVIHEDQIDVGCGAGEAENCLGAGSLEITIDGKTVVAGGDYDLGSDSRIIAYNTFHQCSRKWYDFDVKPIATPQSLRQTPARRLSTATPDVFDVIHGLKDTMIDRAVCEDWLAERQSFGDLFAQPGHSSTIIVQTPDVNFHIEYRQESERCSAHSLDVWMSSVSPSLYAQEWEGVIGETKMPSLKGVDSSDRQAVLKHADDADYEVTSAFSAECKGCAN